MEEYVDQLVKSFETYHQEKPQYVFSCGGRFEILGNHTDHNHGLCIASACDLDITAVVSKKEGQKVVLKSVGFPDDDVHLSKLDVDELLFGSSSALIKGVAAYLIKEGYKVGGFLAYTSSSIFKGAGVSSSAAFEILIGHIFNVLYNNGEIPQLVLCKAGQYAENVYYGKKCGLLDQIGVCYGGVVSIDFEDVDNPVINQIEFPFKDLHFVLINTGGDHSSLSDLYASIPNDMISAANEMKGRYLRECSREQLEEVKHSLKEDEYLRAKHFFDENNRVKVALEAIKNKDKELFIKQINDSRLSCTTNLKNMMVASYYENSPQQACDLVMEASEHTGAVKINGGGFAGSVIALIEQKYLNNVITKLSKKYGEENVKEIFIRNEGPQTIYKF